MKITISMSLFDHLVLSPKAMLGVLGKKGLDIKLPIKAFLDGDKGVIYEGSPTTAVMEAV